MDIIVIESEKYVTYLDVIELSSGWNYNDKISIAIINPF